MKPQTAQKSLGLVYDLNAFVELQEKHGINILDKKSLEQLQLTFIVMRQLVWAGLLSKEPELTLVEAGKRIPLDGLVDVSSQIQVALVKAFAK